MQNVPGRVGELPDPQSEVVGILTDLQQQEVKTRAWTRENLVLAGLTGLAFGLAFPPFRFGFLAYWALVPFFTLLEGKNTKETIRWSYVTGLFVHLTTLYWIGWVTLPGAIGAILFLPLFFVLYGLGHNLLANRLGPQFIYVIPFWWTAIEYLRSLGQVGFPWISLGYTQTYYTALIQYASATSVFGVSFWVVWINVLIYDLLHSLDNVRKCVRLLVAIVALFALPLLHGWIVLHQPGQVREKVRLALIQGNIDPYEKWDEAFLDENFTTYERLTNLALRQRPDLVVWPETALPTYIRYDAHYLRWMREHVRNWDVPVLTGVPDYDVYSDGSTRTYNAAFLFDPNQNEIQRYDKIQLVPFGERVPYQGMLGWFKRLLDRLEMGEGDFSPGKAVRVFSFRKRFEADSLVRDVRFGTVICFESVFPDLVRKFVARGAEFLIVITNDGWFGRTSGPYQHAQAAVFRAIENRCWLARCANTGISAFIDPYGRVVKRSGLDEEAILVGDVELRKGETFFSKHGNVFSWAVSLANLLPFGMAFSGRAFRSATQKREASEWEAA